MTELNVGKPEATEYLPYYGRYISLVPEGDIVAVLGEQLNDTLAFLRSIPESKGGLRYAPGKWSVRELLGHMIDTERVFAFRALCFARNDRTPLPGFSENDYVSNASFDDCTLEELAAEFKSVRESTLFLFRHLDAEAWKRGGVANDSAVSVRALAYILAGHELHHMSILRDRYLQPEHAG